MVENFHKELDRLKEDVIDMALLSKKMLSESVDALKDNDLEKAKGVIEEKGKLSTMDYEIEQRCLILLTLHQPMAGDMREMACILKMITYLTRIGRYGKDIAKVTIELESESRMDNKLVSIPHMGGLVCGMIDDAIEAFKMGRIDCLSDFGERDDDVDSLRYSIFRECLSYMMEDQKAIASATHYIMVARYLERCADHACKIAEKIIYMVTGEHVEIDPSVVHCGEDL